MAKKTIFMGTTTIEAGKTASEIMTVLVQSGARQIATDYDTFGNISGLRFMINAQGRDILFALPVRVDPLLPYLRHDKAQARRVAWRQLFRWVQAQFALIDLKMVKPEEVYAPYAVMPNGQTLFEVLSTSQFKQLAAPEVKSA